MKDLMKFVYSMVAVVITWYVCGVYTQTGINSWYAAAEKPFLTPPSAVFPIVWGIIYVLMIIAFYKVLKRAGDDNLAQKKANELFLGQLILQIIWCYVFFARGYLAAGLTVLILLDLVVYRMIRVFKGLDKYAAYMMFAYFIWLLYASLLNLNFIFIHGAAI